MSGVKGGCRTPACEFLGSLRENLSVLFVSLPPLNPSVFFSPPCNEVPILPGTCLVVPHRGCAPGRAGLHISVAQEGNKDLLGTASPIIMCHIPCLVVPFSILWIPSPL